jgi:hypothetical protein
MQLMGLLVFFNATPLQAFARWVRLLCFVSASDATKHPVRGADIQNQLTFDGLGHYL